MKQTIKFFAIVFLLYFAGSSFAQDNDQPLLIVSSNMVNMSDLGKVNQMSDSVFAPILENLVDEGLIYSFGSFNHLWGDEWNVNYWYTAKDLGSFDKFWNEFVKRVSEKHPDAWGSMAKLFQAHKDNIYTIRNQYPAPQRK